MTSNIGSISGVVLDVDGVLWTKGSPTSGAFQFLENLRRCRIPFCLLTNDCSVSKAQRYQSMVEAGFMIQAEQLVTAPQLTGEWLRNIGANTIMYLGATTAISDIPVDLTIQKIGPVDAVVVGDLFSSYDRHSLNRAANAVSSGAALVAMQRNPCWSDGSEWHIDNGFWIAGLEYVTGREAVVIGKPSPFAYQGAVNRLLLSPQSKGSIAFVSDDVLSDLSGAKDFGLLTIYFGKEVELPSWVDHMAHDMNELSRLVCGVVQ